MKNVIIDIYMAYRNPHILLFPRNMQAEHLHRKGEGWYRKFANFPKNRVFSLSVVMGLTSFVEFIKL